MNLRELSCEGYKMFYGTMLITPQVTSLPSFTESGDWLYKPDTKCWYCNGRSFPESVCQQIAIFIPDKDVTI